MVSVGNRMWNPMFSPNCARARSTGSSMGLLYPVPPILYPAAKLESAMADGVPRGKLKIFFGAFPGAGKTNAMLTAAQAHARGGARRRRRRRRYARKREPEAARGLRVAARAVARRGSAAGELDLDRRARAPSRRDPRGRSRACQPGGLRAIPKRWKDADELLAAGIDVFTTMSVQHLESLNDVVGEITGIREPQTVPDTFFDTADETVMVDMSADELLLRMQAGMVHVGEAEKGVEQHLLQQGQPARAARDRAAAHRRRGRGRGAEIPRREGHRGRLEDAGAPAVLRRARGRAPSTWCEAPRAREAPCRSVDRDLRRDAEPAAPAGPRSARASSASWASRSELGANTAIVTGNDVAQAIVDYTREQNIATVVVGADAPRIG